ncbi:hypothetical protein [Sphingobium sp.]|uniref:hypothetical protein n=1 Tax=Sphingobium sp. TaxID=1912891 RepID=UPI003BB5CD7B
MIFSRILLAPAALLLALPVTAHAQGLGAEAGYGRADGGWGAELGAGYALGLAGFRLTPGAGVHLRNGDVHPYGRVEASYTIPLSATLGAGVRISEDNVRPYATVALPLFPMLRAKANVGPRYYALGLTVGY